MKAILVAVALLAAAVACEWPTTTNGKIQATMDVAYNAGFTTESELLAATTIAIAESSLNPDARHYHPEYAAYDRGLWQISGHWWPQYTDAQCDNPTRAIRIVIIISKNGTDFTPWDTWKNGSAQSHFNRSVDGWPAIRPLVQKFLQDKDN